MFQKFTCNKKLQGRKLHVNNFKVILAMLIAGLM